MPKTKLKPMSEDEVQALPVSFDLETAGRAWGFGRTKSHELARADEFPCPVKRFGSTYRVLKRDLLVSLGYSPAQPPAPAAHPDAA